MQLTSHAREQDLTSEIDDICDSDATSYPLKHKVRRINSGLEELVGKIVSADGTWQFDDTNYTNEPVGTGTLVEGQQRYHITSEYLDIEMIEVLNKVGTMYQKILPLDFKELGEQSPEEYFGTESNGSPRKGQVQYYDKIGDQLYLYNAPAATSHTLAAGIRIWFKRTINLYTMTDNTTMTTGHASREPGIPSPYHKLLCYMAAIPFCAKYHKDRVSSYQTMVLDLKTKLLKLYNAREQDTQKRATMKSSSLISYDGIT